MDGASASELQVPRVFVYGSCVARDTIEFAATGAFELCAYVARQSLISVGSNASAHLPDLVDVASKFQARMIRSDFAGNLLERIQSLLEQVDVLLWDLTDERHGVYRLPDGSFVTRSIDAVGVASVRERLQAAEHIPFGSDEHFALWTARMRSFSSFLEQRGLIDRTVVLNVPWAAWTTTGDPSPWSMGVKAPDANKNYERYYAALTQAGFAMIELHASQVRADPTHRWGLAPFHYTPDVYREVLARLAERHGRAKLRQD